MKPTTPTKNIRRGNSSRRWRILGTALLIAIGLHIIIFLVALSYYPNLSRSLFASTPPAGQPAPTSAPRPTSDVVQPKKADVASDTSQWNQRVEQQVQKLVTAANSRDENENRSVLAEKAKELNRVSSDQSLEQLESILSDALQLQHRETQPVANPPSGRFDAKSAQIHTIRRESDDAGNPRYISTLVDAQGRSMELEMTQEEGESVYETMKIVQENPLLEKVYRRFVMPAMDKATTKPSSNKD